LRETEPRTAAHRFANGGAHRQDRRRHRQYRPGGNGAKLAARDDHRRGSDAAGADLPCNEERPATAPYERAAGLRHSRRGGEPHPGERRAGRD